MRDVTDNRTGELAVGEVKRGRGRPRKVDAMSNAERQRAYRARVKSNPVTVTKKVSAVSQVDAYDESRLEVDALRAELMQWREMAVTRGVMLDKLRTRLLEAERQRDEILGWGVDAVDLKELATAVRAKKRVTKKAASSASAE